MKLLTPNKIDNVPIDDLRSHPQNPRRGNLDVIKASIQRNGFYGAVVAQKATKFLLVGNHRWQAAKELGHTTIPTLWLDVDDATALRILLVDNRANDLADHNSRDLAKLLERLRDESLDGTGYTDDDLAALINDVLATPTEEDFGSMDAAGVAYIIGPDYRFKVERHVYETWLEDLRQSAGFDEPAINQEILNRLGFVKE